MMNPEKLAASDAGAPRRASSLHPRKCIDFGMGNEMKVRELIKALKAYDPELPVVMFDLELGGCIEINAPELTKALAPLEPKTPGDLCLEIPGWGFQRPDEVAKSVEIDVVKTFEYSIV